MGTTTTVQGLQEEWNAHNQALNDWNANVEAHQRFIENAVRMQAPAPVVHPKLPPAAPAQDPLGVTMSAQSVPVTRVAEFYAGSGSTTPGEATEVDKGRCQIRPSCGTTVRKGSECGQCKRMFCSVHGAALKGDGRKPGTAACIDHLPGTAQSVFTP